MPVDVIPEAVEHDCPGSMSQQGHVAPWIPAQHSAAPCLAAASFKAQGLLTRTNPPYLLTLIPSVAFSGSAGK